MKFVYPLKNKTPDTLFDMNRTGGGGYYPLGSNNAYHGGIHLWPGNEPVVAIADGEIVAYRYMSNYKPPEAGRETPKYSNCFVLMRHEYESPKEQKLTFYTLYMHLRPWSDCTDAQKGALTAFGKPGLQIVNVSHTLNLHSSKELGDNRAGSLSKNAKVVASRLDGTWAEITEGEHAGKYFCHTYRGVQYGKPIKILAEPQLDALSAGSIKVNAGDVLGYAGLYEDQVIGRGRQTVHVEVFAGSDAENFLNNAKHEGKPSHIVIESQTSKKKSERDPASAEVDWFKRYAKTEVERLDPNDTSEWVQVKEKRVVGELKKAWLHDKYPDRKEYKTPPPTISNPPTLKHYTARADHLDDIKSAFPGYEITGEDAGEGGINYFRETGATKFTYAAISSKNTAEEPWRLVYLDVGDEGKVYWVPKSRLRNNKALSANTEKCSKTSPEFELEDGEEIPQEYAVALDEARRIIYDTKLWYGVELPNGSKGWVPEDKVRLESPYDWPGFSLVKEEDDARTPLVFEPGNLEADYQGLPSFFKNIIDIIDTDHDGTIRADELKRAFTERPDVAERLSRLICVHPSEWWGGGEDYAPWKPVFDKLGEANAEKFKERLNELCWWKEVKDKLGASFPESPIVYHWHPVAFVEHMNSLGFAGLSFQQLKAISEARDVYVNRHLEGINQALVESDINTAIRVAHFLAQIVHESASLRLTAEGGADDADYEGFKGRGLMQLTWEKGYADYGTFVGEDFTSSQANKEKLEVAPHAARSAGWVWSHYKKLNGDADRNDLIYITYRINGGFNGYDHRLEVMRRAVEVLGVDTATDYQVTASKAAESLKGCFAWGIWHDSGTSAKPGCSKDDVKALAGYKAFVSLHNSKGRPLPSRNWYGYNKVNIRTFVDGRIAALS